VTDVTTKVAFVATLLALGALLAVGVAATTRSDARRQVSVTVPDVVGLSRSEAISQIEANGLSAAPAPGRWSAVEVQSPEGGTVADGNTVVQLWAGCRVTETTGGWSGQCIDFVAKSQAR